MPLVCKRHQTSLEGTGVYDEHTILITEKRQGTCRPICKPTDEEIRTKWEKYIGVWRILVAHKVWDFDVTGSNPVAPTILKGVFKYEKTFCALS